MADQASALLSAWLRRRRIAAAAPHLQGKVLDFGCGSGALASLCAPERYLGVDIDESSLDIARRDYPKHTFGSTLPLRGDFDLVVMLAVIEHVSDPPAVLRKLAKLLTNGGRILMTTPYRRAAWMHSLGASLGLFSKEAREEHTTFFDLESMRSVASEAGLSITVYRRFLLGANQLFVAVRS